MPRSKPPRRRYRGPGRNFDKTLLRIYDRLETLNHALQQEALPLLPKVPPHERKLLLARFAENRTLVSEGRAELFQSSPTPVFDALLREAQAKP
jgi:hypothetical protein